MNVIIANKYQTLLGSAEIDVIKTSYGIFEVDEIVNLYKNFFYNKLIIDVTAIRGYEDIGVIQGLSLHLDMSKVILLLDDSIKVNSPMYISKLVSFGIYNFTKKVETVKFLIEHPNQYKDVANYQNVSESKVKAFNDEAMKLETEGEIGRRVLGIKNVTDHAGATTLGYLMKKHLQKYYSVVYYEIDKTDFVFFNDEKCISTYANSIENEISNSMNEEVVLVDLNMSPGKYCDEVIYLIEPGIIKLNKLIKNHPGVFSDLKDKKNILNMSVLSERDVKDFEKESGSKIFFNVPYTDDKLNDDVNIRALLIALGYTRVNEDAKSSLFGLF